MGAVEIRSDELGKLIPTGMAGIRQQIKAVICRLFLQQILVGTSPLQICAVKCPLQICAVKAYKKINIYSICNIQRGI